ncbi:hypothetical protein Ahy_B06g081424 isoform A [Arachis hypogaea]|uniref:Uncharacterized protein n=1 Tax=Arachis hypogaea TaxID=3818 RepID=A0A444YL42_ARAHY|nr:hypothetical protein Ahy_B06g081424 isoform A [Arachis hypogaea]
MFLSHEDVTLNDVNDLQSLRHVRTRGCLKNRLRSNMKKRIANATKKKKKPALSELNFLDGGSMIQSNSSLYCAHDMNYPGEDGRSFESCTLQGSSTRELGRAIVIGTLMKDEL